MRDRLQRLGPVQRHAEREERDAADALAKVNAALAGARGTLEELERYRDGYHEKSRELTMWHGAHWRDYRSFLARLDQAIAAQRDVVADAERRRGMVLRLWQDKRRSRRSTTRWRCRGRCASATERLAR